ncbi:MAG: acetolactate synthase small subunit [Actinomycetota bacterium]|nr:acetolactate synthase small subunit [Actinomycetota bacterium]MDK1017156.1 acetolactate synthase small subunit [Actinomycetota bacterium]MDK1019648.1 acetolactate synthase small subunit [Actinomycetota bacterium]MDK1027208.1 acetolactate synthase small subunit [Actinomycetota bacterium]MDK1037966.1 acetolactate synthase small subunit [Actinomycetota bacterium]
MQHLITVTVENQPGVLARITSMFARRDFNIHSLAVGPTEDPTRSRVTMVVDGPEMEQIVKQLYKLIHVIKVTEHPQGEAIEREIMLVRVHADPKRRSEILNAANIFDATAVDVGASTITFEVVGEPMRLSDFLEFMKTYGIVSLAKSGRIALAKDAKSQNTKQKQTAKGA